MQKLIALLACLFLIAHAPLLAQTGSTGVGTTTPDSSAQLDVTATNKGMLIPRMTAAQRAAIVNPATGLQVYQTDGTPGLCYFDGVRWMNQTYGLPLNGSGNTQYYGNVTTLAGGGGGTNGAGNIDGGGTAAAFSFAPIGCGVATDASGNLYVGNVYNNRIKKVTQAGLVATFAGSGMFNNTDGTGTAAAFYYPSGIAVDATGNVYVADQYNHRIRKITPAGVVTTLAGGDGSVSSVGLPGAGNIGGTGTAAAFNRPIGVALDATGNIYMADYGNNEYEKSRRQAWLQRWHAAAPMVMPMVPAALHHSRALPAWQQTPPVIFMWRTSSTTEYEKLPRQAWSLLLPVRVGRLALMALPLPPISTALPV